LELQKTEKTLALCQGCVKAEEDGPSTTKHRYYLEQVVSEQKIDDVELESWHINDY